MKSAGRVWTPYEDERMRVLALSGTSAAEIATQIKRSESAVRNPVEDRSGQAEGEEMRND
jgi:hypothetical protein